MKGRLVMTPPLSLLLLLRNHWQAGLEVKTDSCQELILAEK